MEMSMEHWRKSEILEERNGLSATFSIAYPTWDRSWSFAVRVLRMTVWTVARPKCL